MGIFCVLLFTPIIMQHFKITGLSSDYEKKNKKAMAFFFTLLTILVMFRHESVGNDTRNYIYIFEKFSNMPWSEVGKDSLELGFSYFNKFVSLFTDNYQVFFAVTAVITSAMIYPTYKRLCVDSALTIVILCTMANFVMMFSGIRQMLAIGIGFIAYEFTRKKKLIPFIICVVVAMLFHTSAFMLLFMYPLFHARITKKWLLVVVPVLGVIFVFNKEIFSFLNLIISRITRFDGEITSTGSFTMLLLFIIFTVFAFLVPDETKLDKETIALRNFLLLTLVIQMFAPLHNLAMRMNYYYSIFIPLLLPKIVESRSSAWSQVAVFGRHVMVVFFLIYFFINANGGGNLNVFPYHFFWEIV